MWTYPTAAIPMGIVCALLLFLGWRAGSRPTTGKKVGALLWTATPLYYVFEIAAWYAARESHDPL